MSGSLLAALGLGLPGAPRLVQLIGGGGKTTAMFTLAHELVETGAQVLTTTTTRIYAPSAEQSPALILTHEDPDPRRSLDAALTQHGHATVARARLPGGKLAGLGTDQVDALLEGDPSRHIVAECDGSAGRSLKAHAPHEPVLSTAPSLVIAVVGLDILGAPLDDVHVHRAALLSRRLGLPLGSALDTAAVAAAIAAYLERIPPQASTALLLTKLTPEREPAARALAGASPKGTVIATSSTGDVLPIARM